jgi:hypothetical protein
MRQIIPLHSNVLYESLRLWTFPHCEPSFLEFRSVGGGLRIGCSMKKLGRRKEVGLLVSDEAPGEPPREATIRVIGRRFRIKTWWEYASPESMETSAARVELDIGELWVAANVFPMHVAVRLGKTSFGKPEYDWAKYRQNHV